MGFLLDTNICSAHMRTVRLAHRFIQYGGRIFMPTIVLAELYGGAFKASDPSRLLAGIETLLEEVVVLDFDSACARRFGEIRGVQLRTGQPSNVVDLMIASIALTHDLTLVTHNTVDFVNIPALRLEDWVQ